MKSIVLAIGAVALIGAAGVSVSRRTTEAQQHAASAAAVERGSYLVRTMGCNDCHTPWKMGP
jgi:uncharacterized membrane protein